MTVSSIPSMMSIQSIQSIQTIQSILSIKEGAPMESNIDIILNAYDKGLKSGLAQAKREMKDFSSTVNDSVTTANKALTSLGGTISTVISALALYKIGGFLKDTAIASSRFQEMGIVMNVVGKNAGYSAEQLAYVDEQMRKTGISMTESRTAITKLSQAHIDLSMATKLARAAQDAAVIGNMNSSEALDAMIHGITSAQVEVLSNIGINVSWEQSYAKVAKETGRATTSFSEQEKMMIRVNAALEAATRIQGAYEASMTNAGKQLRTLTGRELPDFKVAMGKAFDPAMAEVVLVARDTLAKLREEITKPDIQKALQSIGSSISETAKVIGEVIPSALSNLMKAITPITDWYNSFPDDVKVGLVGGIIGKVLFGPVGILGSLIYMHHKKIEDFKKAHPEIFGNETPNGTPWVAGPFKIPAQEPPNLNSSLPPEKVLPTLSKSTSSLYNAELDKMKAANQTILLMLEDTYKKGQISLEQYFSDRLSIINQEYEKEAAVIKQMASAETSPNEKAKLNAKLFALEQSHTRDVIKLSQDKAKDISDLENATSKAAIERNKATTETELADIKNKYDRQVISLEEYVNQRTKILSRSYELDKASLETEIQHEDEIKKRIELEAKLYVLAQKYKKDLNDISQEALETEKKTALERAQAISGMYQQMNEASQSSYDAQIVLLDEQARRYKQLKIDQLVIDKWYKEQSYQLQKQQALLSNDFSEGWKQAYKDLLKDGVKAGQLGYDTFNQVITDIKSSLSSFIEDAFSGNLKSAQEYFQAFAQAITKTWTNMVAEMIAKWMMLSALKGLGLSSFLGFSSGGSVPSMTGSNIVNPSGAALGFADGGKIPGSSPTPTADNLLIRATAGEWIQPVSSVQYYGAQVMEAIRQRMIPRDFFSNIKLPSMPAFRPSYAFADGGSVSGGYSVSVPVSISGVDNARSIAKSLSNEIERTVIRVMREQLS